MTVQALSLPALWGTFRTQVIGRKFARDVGILTVANFVGAALSFVQGILVARWLGPELYGVAALVMSYPLLVYTFFDARSPEASVKYLSEFHVRNERDRALAMCKLGYMVDSAIASLTFLVVLITAPWAAQSVAHRPEAVGLIMIYAAAFVPNALIGTSCAALMTLGRFVLIAWVDVLANFLRVTLVLGLVLTDWQVPGIVWGNAIATMATGLLYGIIARVLIRRAWGVSPLQGAWSTLKGRRREIFSFLAYNDLNALLGMIPKQLDVALLGYFRNPMEVGYYRLAKNLAGAVSYAVRPLQLVIYPDLVRLWGSGDQQIFHQKVRRLLLQLGLPLGLAVLAGTQFVPFVLPSLVGHAYRPAMVATQLLLVGWAIWLAFFWVRPAYFSMGHVRLWSIAIGIYTVGFVALS